jgi:hypothetical protein
VVVAVAMADRRGPIANPPAPADGSELSAACQQSTAVGLCWAWQLEENGPRFDTARGGFGYSCKVQIESISNQHRSEVMIRRCFLLADDLLSVDQICGRIDTGKKPLQH